MGKYKIVYTKVGAKEKKIASEAGFEQKIINLIDVLRSNPFSRYPPFEKLPGNMSGAYSRRINRQHRLIYMVYEEE